MKTAIRRTLVALWCLLALCVLVLWVRGQFRQDQFVYAPAGGRLWQVFSHSGEVGFSTATPWPNAERAQWFSLKYDGLVGPRWRAGPSGPSAAPSEWDLLGLHVLSGAGQVPLNPDGTASWQKELPEEIILFSPSSRSLPPPIAPVRFRDVYISLWLPTVILALYPSVLILKKAREIDRRRQTRKNRCLCPGCGYDIRATPDAAGPLWDRCPECGRSTGETERF